MSIANISTTETFRPVTQPMSWMSQLEAAEKSTRVVDGRRKGHYRFQDGSEMVEEYDLETRQLQCRAWRRGSVARKPEWELELGEVPPEDTSRREGLGIRESSQEPVLLKRLTPQHIEWRIRNLPYPLSNFLVSVDDNQPVVTIKTRNKKYYKQLVILELERLGLKAHQSELKYTLQYNTLILTYRKPREVLNAEKQIYCMLADVKAANPFGDMAAALR